MSKQSNHYANKPFRARVGDYVTDEYGDDGEVVRIIGESDGATIVVNWAFHGDGHEHDTNDVTFVGHKNEAPAGDGVSIIAPRGMKDY